MIANIATVFQWQPSEIKGLSLDEFLDYHEEAVARYRANHTATP
ncbi:GpE family phage tail protein [Desulfoluna butyratoxydans]|uniref:Burkholderia phage phie202 gp27 n=1 Tax=Desulfoluna butyratoxydans TaxID=231438 RepID=A0A4U8YSV1_9BACT|nr:GpE family phage tail protein [Desulfoluna butyratoxydans]VFQ44373.1 burkholderia phage phie202 gp27 [Desulfoluna butyratoxydans]